MWQWASVGLGNWYIHPHICLERLSAVLRNKKNNIWVQTLNFSKRAAMWMHMLHYLEPGTLNPAGSAALHFIWLVAHCSNTLERSVDICTRDLTVVANEICHMRALQYNQNIKWPTANGSIVHKDSLRLLQLPHKCKNVFHVYVAAKKRSRMQ